MSGVKNFIKRYKNFILIGFAAIETAIYIAFIVIQLALGGDEPTVLKYTGILLCFAVSASLAPACGADGKFLCAALLFTAISDLFIFILNFYEVGVSTFIVTQVFYFVRIYFVCRKKPFISLAVRLFLVAAALIALGVTENLTALTALVAIYFPMLLCNAADSVLLLKVSKQYILFFIGLLLFIGCDVCVGLYNLQGMGIPLPDGVNDFAGNAIWVFYLPSQVLIVLSAHCAERGVVNEK